MNKAEFWIFCTPFTFLLFFCGIIMVRVAKCFVCFQMRCSCAIQRSEDEYVKYTAWWKISLMLESNWQVIWNQNESSPDSILSPVLYVHMYSSSTNVGRPDDFH